MSKLNLRSGRLWRSLSPNAPAGDSKRTFKIDEFGGFKFEIESLLPYAKIQDTGGFIKATPTGGFMKYKMAWFMWFLHQKTNNVFWLKNAWAVRRDGGVKIKKTNYFTDGMKEFKTEFEKSQNKLVNDIVSRINDRETIDITLIAKEFKEFAELIPFDFSIAIANNMNKLPAAIAKMLNNAKTATWI